MAKKKSETDEKPSPAKKAPKKATPKPAADSNPTGAPADAAASSSTTKSAKAPGKAPARQTKPKPALLGGGSMIDTSLVASAAANLLLARRKGRDQIDDPISIEQIKSDLSKDPLSVAGEVLDQHAESSGARRPNLPTGHQSGYAPTSQTIGHAAERTAVPRRTAG
jgi:hypothetical protein